MKCKFLSLVLRHQPETIGISLSEEGWVDTSLLIQKMNEYGKQIDLETLIFIIETNDKKRFGFNKDKTEIRANQGHSVKINFGYVEQTPPEFLFHGTAQRNIASIFQTGLEKRNRHHVHLSENVETAHKVGQRHGKPIVLKVLSDIMYKEGYKFYRSENNVWLTEVVPVKFITTNQ